MRLFPLFFFAALFSFASALAAAIPQPGESPNLDEKLAAPARVYTSEEDREAFAAEAVKADAVFVGRIESAILSRMGFGGAPVPMTRLGFTGVETLKGGPFESTAFLYRKSPESIAAFREIPALVLLKRSNDAVQTLFVENILPADEASLSVVKAALAGAAESCGEAEPVCQ